MTTRDIRAHLREMYQVEVSADLISRVTDGVVEELGEWQSRPLDSVYPVVFIDALMVKIRDGVVTNRAVYLAIGVDCEGTKQVLGLWIGPTAGESAKFWLSVLSDLKSRGVADVCIVCCDGLTGLPDAIGVVWPQAIVQLCVVHLIRASLRYASKKYWVPLTRDLRPIYTAADEQAAAAALEDFAAAWGDRYPAIVKVWRAHWAEFIPFLAFPPEVRKVIYTTNPSVIWSPALRPVSDLCCFVEDSVPDVTARGVQWLLARASLLPDGEAFGCRSWPRASASWRLSRRLSSVSCRLRSWAACSLCRSDGSDARWPEGTGGDRVSLVVARSCWIWSRISAWE